MGLLDGLGSLGQLGGMLQKVQGMQAEVKRIHAEAEARRYEGQAGGGVVVATVNGKGELVSVKIDPSAKDSNDADMLGELIVAAVSSASTDAKASLKEDIAEVTGGLGLPGVNEMLGLG